MYSSLKAGQDFLGDKKIFSTYASAQEVVQNQFQPSGIDYIIHVLGDEQRKKYLDSFKTSDFDYAVTIKEEHNDWENWIKRANWFFYRELYDDYHPVFENDYQRYWEKNKNSEKTSLLSKDINLQCTVQNIDISTKKIVITMSEPISGVADLFINYEVKKNPTSRKAKFIILKNLIIQDTQIASKNYNSLRSKNAEFIPCEIKNGYGELILTSKPKNSTYLDVYDCFCEKVFIIPKLFHTALLTDENWLSGINRKDDKLILFTFNTELLEVLRNSEAIKNEKANLIIEQIDFDSNWIRVTVDKSAKFCAYPATLNFINKKDDKYE